MDGYTFQLSAQRINTIHQHNFFIVIFLQLYLRGLLNLFGIWECGVKSYILI